MASEIWKNFRVNTFIVYEEGEGWLVLQDGRITACTLDAHRATRLTIGQAVEAMKGQRLGGNPRPRRIFRDDATDYLPIGQSVEKVGGDYVFKGTIVASFSKISGKSRYVVENGDGILHIFSVSNLKPL